jgi:hypothetical protein
MDVMGPEWPRCCVVRPIVGTTPADCMKVSRNMDEAIRRIAED